MKKFEASEQWGKDSKKVSVLSDPIGEFNARNGWPLEEYLAYQDHLQTEHPNLGEEEWKMIQKELPEYEIIEDSRTGQKIRVQKFNWPEDGEIKDDQTVTIFNMPFSVPIDLDHVVYQHYLLAQALGSPLMIIENPGYGKSDKLSASQKAALREGSFSPVAKSMLSVIKTTGAKSINCVGYSMGSEITASIASQASEHGIVVNNLFVLESPRVEEQNPVKLAANFAAEANNVKFAWKHPVDPVLREISELKLGLPKGLFTYGLALFKGGLKSDIETALSTQPDMKVIVASGGSSKVSPSEANARIVKELQTKFPDRSIRRIIMPGESHAFGDTGKRFAHIVGKIVLK
jgi:pimeloyl-ACP methyl ester carboxylesterase